MQRVPDKLEMRARAVLEHKSPELLAAFLALRAEAQRKAVEEWPKSGSPSADDVNGRNQRMLDRAAALLGPENFEKIPESQSCKSGDQTSGRCGSRSASNRSLPQEAGRAAYSDPEASRREAL